MIFRENITKILTKIVGENEMHYCADFFFTFQMVIKVFSNFGLEFVMIERLGCWLHSRKNFTCMAISLRAMGYFVC